MAVSRDVTIPGIRLQGHPWDVSKDQTTWVTLCEGGDVDQPAPQDNTTTVRTACGFASFTTPGVSQPLTIAVPVLPAATQALHLLRSAQSQGDSIWLRQLAKPAGQRISASAADLSVAIAQAGTVTFTGTGLPSLRSALKAKSYGPGGLLVVDGKSYLIDTVPASTDVPNDWDGDDFTVWDLQDSTAGKANKVETDVAANQVHLIARPGYLIGPLSGTVTGMNQMNQTVDGFGSITAISFDLGGAELIPALSSSATQITPT